MNPLRLPLLFTAILLTINVTCQKVRIGECPDVEPVLNFNATAFSGLWYENRKYVNRFTLGQKCVTTRISSNADSVLVFDTLGYEKFFKPVRLRGFALQTYGPDVGAFSVGVPIAEDLSNPNLNVIDIDYDQYAILYSCRTKMGGLSHLEWLWVLSRTPYLTAPTLTAILLRLSHHGFRPLALHPTEQNFCPDNIPGV
ncbi:apolipoprotein D-like [Amphibalanus amphitrite]|uniref:apolipoprotein D-like n=1 Tax=Amphibalanus amphitrite TaxID=1232801 RepID=UPI001C8FB377|nr:apolipoprotein D-like [Amphibalanus amphitrite]